MTFDRDLKETLEQMQKERAVDKRYREAFDADLEFMMTPQVDLAAERARDRITPSQPSREVERQDRQYSCEFALPGMRTLVWAALFALIGGFLFVGMML